jgi:GNAT superfamily N-acetyltransferase
MRPGVRMNPPANAVSLREAREEDMAALNGVIERAVMTWQLAERVKRLSLPSYCYHAHDLAHLHIVVAEDAERAIIGVAAWEPATPRDPRAGQRGLLLHGLYVDPSHLRRGVGTHLLDAALAAVRTQGFDGLLVKAQADAIAFFESRGMQRLPVEDPARDYPHRFWQTVPPTATAH